MSLDNQAGAQKILTATQRAALAKQHEAKKAQLQAKGPEGFDLRSNIKNRDGEVETQQDYFIHLEQSQQYFERPVGSGNLFFLSGEEAGRVVIDEDGKKKFDFQAEHELVSARMSEEEEMKHELKASRAAAEALQKELAAIKKEKAQDEKDAQLKMNQAVAAAKKSESK